MQGAERGEERGDERGGFEARIRETVVPLLHVRGGGRLRSRGVEDGRDRGMEIVAAIRVEPGHGGVEASHEQRVQGAKVAEHHQIHGREDERFGEAGIRDRRPSPELRRLFADGA